MRPILTTDSTVELMPPTDPPNDLVDPKPPPDPLKDPIEPKPPSDPLKDPIEPKPPPDPTNDPNDPKPPPDPPSDPLSSLDLFIARLWAYHIHERFRDATAVKAPSYSPYFRFLSRDTTRDFHSHARRAKHRGSRRGA